MCETFFLCQIDQVPILRPGSAWKTCFRVYYMRVPRMLCHAFTTFGHLSFIFLITYINWTNFFLSSLPVCMECSFVSLYVKFVCTISIYRKYLYKHVLKVCMYVYVKSCWVCYYALANQICSNYFKQLLNEELYKVLS